MTNQAGMNEQALHAEIARLNKVVQALIKSRRKQREHRHVRLQSVSVNNYA